MPVCPRESRVCPGSPRCLTGVRIHADRYPPAPVPQGRREGQREGQGRRRARAQGLAGAIAVAVASLELAAVWAEEWARVLLARASVSRTLGPVPVLFICV